MTLILSARLYANSRKRRLRRKLRQKREEARRREEKRKKGGNTQNRPKLGGPTLRVNGYNYNLNRRRIVG